jgi:hypothetical protein
MNIKNLSLKALSKFAAVDDDVADYVESHSKRFNKPVRGGKRFIAVELCGKENRANHYEAA